MEKAALKGMFANGTMPVGTEYKTALTDILRAFPYFQLAQVLLAKQMYDSHEPEASMRIKLASVYAPDRKAMYQLFKSGTVLTDVQPQPATNVPDKIAATTTGKEGIKYNFVYNSTTKKTETGEHAPAIESQKNSGQTETFIRKESENKLPVTNNLTKPITVAPQEEKPQQEVKKIEPTSAQVKKVSAPLPIEKKAEKLIVPVVTPPLAEEKADADKKPEEKKEFAPKPLTIVKPVFPAKSEPVPVELPKKTASPIQKTDNEPIPENLKYNFSAWLKVIPEINVDTKNTVNQKEKASIISNFLENLPSISRPKAEFFSPTRAAKLSVTENDEIVSETLASIYLKQGNLQKAVKAYETLLSQFPEKKNIFAPRIEEIRALIRENTKK